MTLKDGRRCLRFSLRLSGCNYSVFTIIQVQIHAWIHVVNTCMYIQNMYSVLYHVTTCVHTVVYPQLYSLNLFIVNKPAPIIMLWGRLESI